MRRSGQRWYDEEILVPSIIDINIIDDHSRDLQDSKRAKENQLNWAESREVKDKS